MFSPDAALLVQNRIAANSKGMLEGGSAYCNIYDGGANESHFCAASSGWDEMVQQVKPYRLMLVALFHAASVLRTATLMLIEFGLSIIDFIRGATWREFWQELMMIPARVVVVVLMRELAINGACMDTHRGLPIIYLNLLGYDEQAHRRGPSSAFARWSLKGIDGAIRRLSKSARLSPARHYDIWILSDHGQEETTPYEFATGKSIRESVTNASTAVLGSVNGSEDEAAERCANYPTRARWLSAGWIAAKLFGEDLVPQVDATRSLQIAAVGPLGLVYLNREVAYSQRVAIARQLVGKHEVPMAAVPCPDGISVLALSAAGEAMMPNECPGELVDHRFQAEIVADLCRLCHHPDAGDIVLSGWNGEEPPMSFVRQHGAHAGFGTDETHGFALLPNDVPVKVRPGDFIRPADLRIAALSRDELHPYVRPRFESKQRHVRLMTYNVHACIGMDGKLSPRRIARVIGDSDADIVALQEVDRHRPRSGYSDQAQEIAKHLEMDYHFHPSWQLREGSYGNAILSRFPMRLIKSGALPQHGDGREPRGAMWVEVLLPDGRHLQVINTHLSVYPTERFTQTQALLVDGWVDAARKLGPVCLIGDFNARPKSKSHQLLCCRLDDVDSPGTHRSTWPSRCALTRLDHIFMSECEYRVHGVTVPTSVNASIASDHLPVVATVDLQIRTSVATSERSTSIKPT